MSAVAAPEQAERQPDPVGSACIPISHTARIDSLETRTATLEAQQNWLHLEQLRAEVGGLRQTVDYLIEYVAERDSAAIARVARVGGAT